MPSLSQLTPLLPSTPYILAYALPLLLLSLLFTFAGTFLTLDRTRSFPARSTGSVYAALPIPGALDNPNKKRKFTWALEGGVGGLVGGYLFGLHLSTALTLLIPATTASASLSPKSFLALWILSSVVTTPLAGRYRYAAYTFFGVSGGTLIALALCVIIHPSLPARIILTAIFLPLFTLSVLASASIPRICAPVFHWLLRVCTASTGAFGIVVAIALILNPKEEGWANVWERLWTRDGEGWGSGREQGLSSAFGVFFAAGVVGDWTLKRWIGECPDEKWDNYLAHYAANLSNQANRAGTFQPLVSFWDRVFPPTRPFEPSPSHKKRGEKAILFPNETDLKSELPLPLPFPVTMHNVAPAKLSKTKSVSGGFDKSLVNARESLPTTMGLLKRPRARRFGYGIGNWGKAEECVKTKRKPVKFGDVSSDSDDSDDDEDEERMMKEAPRSSCSSSPEVMHKEPTRPGPGFLANQPPTRSDYSSSTPTLVDGHLGRNGERESGRDARLEALEVLDYEREIESIRDKLRRGFAAPAAAAAAGAGGRTSGKEFGEEVEYPDWEDEKYVTTDVRGPPGRGSEEEGEDQTKTKWTPAFLKRHQHQSGPGSATAARALPPRGTMPVPATPSLIYALDRVAVAQRDAFGQVGMPSKDAEVSTRAGDVLHAGSPGAGVNVGGGGGVSVAKEEEEEESLRAPRWEEFWREVRVKAQT